MILIVTGVEVVIENCLTKVRKILPDFKKEKFPIIVDDGSCHLSCYTSTHGTVMEVVGRSSILH